MTIKNKRVSRKTIRVGKTKNSMRHFNFAVMTTFLLTTFILTSCNQTSKSEDKDKALIEKENELLKKENELLKKEQELNQKSAKTTTINTTIADNLDFMKKLKGKYPYEVKLLDNSILKKRLKQMLGSRFDFMKSIWEVETPIEIENGLFYAWAMQAHSGGDPGAVLMVDFYKNVLYVGIRENEKEKLYSEDGSLAPQRLQDWANEQ